MKQNTKIDIKIKFIVFSLIAFVVTLVTAAYAWVTSDLITPSTSLYVGSVTLSVIYHGSPSAIISDLAPGESVTKTFSVENEGSTDQVYNLYWVGVTNNLVDKNYFMYKIKNVDTGEELFYPKYLPTNSTHIKYGITIPAGETHNYEMTIYYIDDPKYNQLQNADLYFAGDVSIEQGSNEQRIQDRLSIFVNGVHSDYLPTLSQYSIDTSRTFCTEGSSISIVNGDISISNLTDVTSCELYLVSSAAAAITNDPYNLLIIDTDGGTLSTTPEIKYRYSGDVVSLGVPEKTGYAFLGWQASGTGTQVIDNTKVVMGTTYSYVKALWTEGHWNKIVQTCGSNGVATYTRTYKTCDATITNYTKEEKTCGVSNWEKTTSVCGVTQVTKKTYVCAASGYGYPTSATSTQTNQATCTEATPACSASSNVGNEKITCIATAWAYPLTASSTATNQTECSESMPSCLNSFDSGNQKITCTATAWAYPSTASSTVTNQTSCTEATPACSASGNVGNEKVTCTATAWAYPSTPNTIETAQVATNGVVPANTTPSCASNSDIGNTKITNTTTEWRKKGKTCAATSYAYVTTNPSTSTSCVGSVVTAPTCNSITEDNSYITACKYNCRRAATPVYDSGTCVCINTDAHASSLYDAGCTDTRSRCNTICTQLGGSLYSYNQGPTCDSTPSYTCANVSGCGSTGSSCTQSGGYCYKYNQTSCASGYSISAYRPETKTCTGTYEFSNINNLTNDNCESSVTTAPSSCTKARAGTYITECTKTKYTRRTYVCAVSKWTKNTYTCEASKWTKNTYTCEANKWTKRTYTCEANTWTYPGTANSSTTVAPSNCSETTPACSASSNVGNEKITCGDPKTYGWTSTTTSSSETCTASGSCSSATSGNSYVTNCSANAWNFGTPSTSTVSSCTPNPVTCAQNTSGQINRTCDPNYSYSLSSGTQTDTVESCALSNFTCDSTTSGEEYTTACTPLTSGYGYSPSTTTSGSCFVDTSHSACSSSNVGATYVYACELVED